MDVWPIHDVFLDTILMTPVIPVKTEYHLIIPVVILANEYDRKISWPIHRLPYYHLTIVFLTVQLDILLELTTVFGQGHLILQLIQIYLNAYILGRPYYSLDLSILYQASIVTHLFNRSSKIPLKILVVIAVRTATPRGSYSESNPLSFYRLSSVSCSRGH